MTLAGEDPVHADPEAAGAPEWLALLEYLAAVRGFDFSGYKPASLMRRVRHRMAAVGIDDFGAYRDHLEMHPEEFDALFDTILINVTGFFRDPVAWEALAAKAIPALLAGKADQEPIRAWSAGCASGEEAYTIAMVLAEALGPEAFRSRVKVYATDIDDGALGQARAAVYHERQLDGVPPELRERYFQKTDEGWAFRKDLRRQVIFGRHNLLEDAPISHIDLLVCRNVLIYFNAEAQAQILARFHFALNSGGHLFLGRAETLMAQASAFDAVDAKRRISAKSSRVSLFRADRGALRGAGRVEASDALQLRLRELALDAAPGGAVLVDRDGRLGFANARARALFNLTTSDLGTPLQDLQLSYRPVDLRSLLEQARNERQPARASGIECRTSAGETTWLDVQVAALFDGGEEPLGTAITFTEVTEFRHLQGALEQANQELETAYEELQSTNEELETTNEELQSTIEELETTNEELQSTNEELETINEELHSTNEALNTSNDELHRRTHAVDAANQFLETVLGSLTSAVAVVDRELRVMRWNRQAEELWGLRADEVRGQHLLNLDIGLPVEQLRLPLRACVGSRDPHTVAIAAVNRRGRAVACEVRCIPLGADGDAQGAVIIMDAVAAGGGSAEVDGA